MRVAIFLFACAIAVFGDVEIDVELDVVECPLDSTVEKIFPHTYCNMFNQCSNRRVLELRCSGQLLFNIETLECDWPYNVDCAGRNISYSIPEQITTTESDDESDGTCNNCDPAEAPEICAQSESDGVLVAHENCNRFYQCAAGKPVTLRCPKKLMFNAYKGQCDWAEKVDCGNRTITDDDNDENVTESDGDDEYDGPVHDDPTKASQICAEDDSDNVLVANEYCNWFYICSGGRPVSMVCVNGTVFNPNKGRCDWIENFDCGNRTILPPSDNDNEIGDDKYDGPVHDDPTKASEICAEDESDNVLVANEYCNWFYICSAGRPVSMVCVNGTVFNPNKGRCDWIENFDCGNRTILPPPDNDNEGNDTDTDYDGPVNDNPAEAATICAQEGSDGTLIAHENCDEFYVCNLYAPFAMRCADKLLYKPETRRCDWPENVDCGDRVIPDRGNDTVDKDDTCNNCDPSEAPEICAREGSDGALVAHENCNQYYKCYAGKPNALLCINTLLFDPLKGWCDLPELVDCGNRTIPDNEDSGNNNPAEAAEICARNGSDGVLVAHEVCSQFYKCSHGEAFELECDNGLQFNPTMGICDWPSNVDCGDRTE